jgi:dTDP-4-amino-4,6-dideoxygalactose transaminase
MINPEIIPFNKPFIIGKEMEYIRMAVESGHISGNGNFSKACEHFFEDRYGKRSMLTSSCTDALEMAALLLNIQPGDEVISPSFSFVSTVNPFVLRGAEIIFADSLPDHPNIDVESVRKLVTKKTKAIVCVHYAGMACDMNALKALADEKKIPLIEDAAHAIEAKFEGDKQLGTIGSLGTFSFHETKNVVCGEGGMLFVNDPAFLERAEILREKGTNRPAFYRGEIKKYEWVDVGSSFLPSELSAAFLYGQLEKIDEISETRLKLWKQYAEELIALELQGKIVLPIVPSYAKQNGHIFYLMLPDAAARFALQESLRKEGIQSVFHYQSLHRSPYYAPRYKGKELKNADRYTDCLLRLPLYHELSPEKISRICRAIRAHFGVE